MRRSSEGSFPAIFVVVLLIVVCAFAWFQAGVEQEVWNRCNPGQHITQWEALLTTTRIAACETEEKP